MKNVEQPKEVKQSQSKLIRIGILLRFFDRCVILASSLCFLHLDRWHDIELNFF